MGRVGPRAAAGLRPRAFPRIIQVRGNALFLAFPARSGIVERHREDRVVREPMEYDFKPLSDDAFELLCRDLIGRRLGATPEGFRPGRGTASTSGTRGTGGRRKARCPSWSACAAPPDQLGEGNKTAKSCVLALTGPDTASLAPPGEGLEHPDSRLRMRHPPGTRCRGDA